MSSRSSRRHHREDRHLCAACRDRKAKYHNRGHLRAGPQHVLCFQCFRSAREQIRARQLAEGVPSRRLSVSARLGPSAPPPSLTRAQIHHRERMLAHLQSTAVGLRVGG
jgi:hypothetical protein